ncbi:hypothetical protein GCM10011579_073930 [Streptomyces albiflavescens]|uniref:Uncharacterized protein n=1 Tax=Streptomyces albiflavescens TaxID=1623582 RepID=A0A918D8V8_9ACTN|nr:hypothetical protein [Streptomyces albiflavescens]GGN84268.1 hypothetical protein GCM10011579_073930 [Streptomyces albiflavescens]
MDAGGGVPGSGDDEPRHGGDLGPVDDVLGAGDDRRGGRSASGGRWSARAVLLIAAAALLLLGGGTYGLLRASDGGTKHVARTVEGVGTAEPSPTVEPSFPPLGIRGGPPVAVETPTPFPDVTYRAIAPLPKANGSAPIYRAKGAVTAAEAAHLADVLGIEDLRATEDGWTTGVRKDGRTPELSMHRTAPGTWVLQTRALGGPDRCKPSTRCSSTGTPKLPSDRVAKAVALPVLKKLGVVNPEVTLEHWESEGVTQVWADPVIDGLATSGWETTLQVDGDGRIVGGGGSLRLPVKGKGAAYPLIDADEALKQLNAAQPAHSATSGKPLVEVSVIGGHLQLVRVSSTDDLALAPFWALEVTSADGRNSIAMPPALSPEDQSRLMRR